MKFYQEKKSHIERGIPYILIDISLYALYAYMATFSISLSRFYLYRSRVVKVM